jgi:F420-non-reducing hydrogenase iron-sulfur subunit
MTTTTLIRPSRGESFKKPKAVGARITVFHCFNAIGNNSIFEGDYEVKSINLPCSGMTSDIVLLKALENGADAVIVLACPENTCHYLEGNLRAKKRVARVKKLLDEAGLDGSRLNFFNVSPGDESAVQSILRKTVSELADLGPGVVH